MRSVGKVLLLGVCLHATLAQATQTTFTDPTTGAVTWQTQTDGVHFSLTQILPDQALAFYLNRGFTREQIQSYTASCIYMTVLRNDTASGVIHFISNDWDVIANGAARKVVSADAWVQRLTTDSIKKSALVAFRWAQFPPEQEYEPGGDWNQGMLAIELSAGSEFDVVARWDIEGKAYQAKLTGVQCAE